MKMSLQSWNSELENKGFIFTLDMIIAMSFTIIILVLANYYVRTIEDPLSKLQMEKTGSDIVSLLEHKGILDSLNSSQINNYLDNFLPVNYDMHINITTKNNIKLSIGNILPTNVSMLSGKGVFVVTQQGIITDYAKLQYWIWLK